MTDLSPLASAPGAINRKPVTTEHPHYQKMRPRWQRCRDAAAGIDAIKLRAEQYLPRLTDQDDAAYAAYLGRAAYFNATWRTISGLAGMLFRKPEQVDAPDALVKLFEDVTLSDVPLHAFAHSLAVECFTVGRVGVLVDYPQAPADKPLTVAEASRLNLRPTLASYCAESIINWKVQPINNVATTTMIVLTEDAPIIGGTEFNQDTERRYRVLDLTPLEGKLVYRVRVFRINKQLDAQEQVGGDLIPLMNGAPLESIPFTFFGVDNLTPRVDDPPLIDLVDLNLAHFRVAADFEHGCHMSALPTAVVAGYSPTIQNEKLYMGSTSAWVFPDPATHASFLEFSGSGLGMLQGNLTHKEDQMAALGARLLNTDTRTVETATSTAIHHSGETSILAAIAQTLSLGLTKALTTFSEWAGLGDQVKFQVNRDFVPQPMDPVKLAALVNAWQAGAISYETLYRNLQDGEIVDHDGTAEEELKAIKANPAPVPTALQAQLDSAAAAKAPPTDSTQPPINAKEGAHA